MEHSTLFIGYATCANEGWKHSTMFIGNARGVQHVQMMGGTQICHATATYADEVDSCSGIQDTTLQWQPSFADQ